MDKMHQIREKLDVFVKLVQNHTAAIVIAGLLLTNVILLIKVRSSHQQVSEYYFFFLCSVYSILYTIGPPLKYLTISVWYHSDLIEANDTWSQCGHSVSCMAILFFWICNSPDQTSGHTLSGLSAWWLHKVPCSICKCNSLTSQHVCSAPSSNMQQCVWWLVHALSSSQREQGA